MKKYCVIGTDISKSLSPAIYNFLFKVYGMDAVYEKMSIPADGLADFISREAPGFAGFNVTMPFKGEICGYLENGREYCSVNTVLRTGENSFAAAFKGYSTDGQGFLNALGCHGKTRIENAMILGAGGAAKAVYNALRAKADSISVYSRSAQGISTHGFSAGELLLGTKRADLLVNCTPLGMSGHAEFETLDFIENFEGFVYDTVYSPTETALVKRARERGLQAFNGLSMLIHQALLAFELYTGIDAAKHYAAIEREIYEKYCDN